MSPYRRIKHLTIKAPDQATLWHGRRILADSFRTASLASDVSSRLLIVRHLDVGAVAVGTSTTALSRQIEKRMQLVTDTAVYALAPNAATATAVYFQDEIEPLTSLVQKLLTKKQPSAWFWPLCVPQYRPHLPVASAIIAVVQAANQKQQHFPAMIPVWQAVTDCGISGALTFINAIAQMGAADLWQAVGTTPPMLPKHTPKEKQLFGDLTMLHPTHQRIIKHWVASASANQKHNQTALLTWLITLMLTQVRKTAVINSPLIADAAALAHSVATQARFSESLSTTKSGAGGDGALQKQRLGNSDSMPDKSQTFIDSNQSVIDVGKEGRPAFPQPQNERERERESYLPTDTTQSHNELAPFPEPTEEAHTHTQAEDSPLLLPNMTPTEGGGLLFTIPIVHHLGLLDCLVETPSLLTNDFPIKLLHQVGKQLNIAKNDAIRLALPAIEKQTDTDPIRWQMPETWHSLGKNDVMADMLAASQNRIHSGFISPNALRKLWILALEQWCQQFAEMSLSELVLRPALVSATKTHIDVIFDLNDIDINVRRTGLDQNLGWVSWLRRVVYFHFKKLQPYGEQDDC